MYLYNTTPLSLLAFLFSIDLLSSRSPLVHVVSLERATCIYLSLHHTYLSIYRRPLISHSAPRCLCVYETPSLSLSLQRVPSLFVHFHTAQHSYSCGTHTVVLRRVLNSHHYSIVLLAYSPLSPTFFAAFSLSLSHTHTHTRVHAHIPSLPLPPSHSLRGSLVAPRRLPPRYVCTSSRRLENTKTTCALYPRGRERERGREERDRCIYVRLYILRSRSS